GTTKKPNGDAVGRPPAVYTYDICHSHQCALDEWNHGAMNGWPDDHAYDQFTPDDIPNYWEYAKKYALADHFFSSMMGPSFPGHMFALAAQTGWAVGNPS